MTERSPALPVPESMEPIFASVPVTALLKGERRLEGEAYLSGGYAIRLRIEASGVPSTKIAEVADVWQPSRLKGITVSSEQGVPFFTATQVFDVQPVVRKWIAPKQTENLEKRYVEPGWILVTCSGNVGEVIISHTPHRSVVLSHDILRVQARNEAALGYLYCFLRSQFGRAMLQSSKYGSIIKHLEPEHVNEVPLPLIPDGLKLRLNERVDRIYEMRDVAYSLTVQAQERFGKEIGVAPKWKAEDEKAFTVRAKDCFGRARRIDGYHYNPRARAVLAALRNTGRPMESLRSLVEAIVLPNRFVRTPASGGLPYVDSEDIFKVNPAVTKFIAAKQDLRPYFVKRRWILLCRSGQIYGICGSVMMADRRHEEKVFSEDLIRIIPKAGGVRPGYLQMVLGHQIYGRPLVLRLAFGTQIPHIAPGDLHDFPVIRFGEGVENEIADQMEKAVTLRADAAEEENRIVAEVEAYLEEMLHPGERVVHEAVMESPESPPPGPEAITLSRYPLTSKPALSASLKVDSERARAAEKREGPMRKSLRERRKNSKGSR